MGNCLGGSKHTGSPGKTGSLPNVEERTMNVEERPTFKQGFRRLYELDTFGFLGKGSFGTVMQCREKATGQLFAVKMMYKSRMGSLERESLFREVAIMNMLGRSLNTVYLYSSYEDADHFYLLEEPCTGGTLYDRMKNKKDITEADVARIILQVCRFIRHCHTNHVAYRDLKPHQFLFLDEGIDAPIKGTDFGLSIYMPPNAKPLTAMVGTPAYMAPEVLSQSYGLKADVWSIGVMTYQLLSGKLPFSARHFLGYGTVELHKLGKTSRTGFLFKDIESREPDYSGQPWDKVSPEAMDFLRRTLIKDPAKRMSSEEAIMHPWVVAQNGPRAVEGGEGGTAAPAGAATPLGDSVVQRLQRFSAMSRFRQLLLVGVSSQESLPEDVKAKQAENLKHVRALFHELDLSGDKCITADELSRGLANSGFHLTEDEATQLVQGLDFLGTGGLELEEFEAAMMDWNSLAEELPADTWTEEAIRQFRALDKDGDRTLQAEELAKALPATLSKEERDKLVKEFMMRGGSKNGGGVSEKEYVSLAKPDIAELSMYDDRRISIKRSIK